VIVVFSKTLPCGECKFEIVQEVDLPENEAYGIRLVTTADELCADALLTYQRFHNIKKPL
jgi:hypothetical protein